MSLDNLLSVQQQKGESLWNYVAHSNATMLEVKNLNEAMVMSALK